MSCSSQPDCALDGGRVVGNTGGADGAGGSGSGEVWGVDNVGGAVESLADDCGFQPSLVDNVGLESLVVVCDSLCSSVGGGGVGSLVAIGDGVCSLVDDNGTGSLLVVVGVDVGFLCAISMSPEVGGSLLLLPVIRCRSLDFSAHNTNTTTTTATISTIATTTTGITMYRTDPLPGLDAVVLPTWRKGGRECGIQ